MIYPSTPILHNRANNVKKALRTVNSHIPESARKAKFEKMSVSPYAFFRGTNHLYWSDFYNDWRLSLFGGRVSTLTWINGDAHVYNFGTYSNIEDQVVYGLDDFDDSLMADYQYDLWRMAVSVCLDIRANGIFDFKAEKKAVKVFAKAYLKEIRNYAQGDIYEEIVLTRETAPGQLGKFLKKLEKKQSRRKMLEKWTLKKKGSRSFDFDNPKLEAVPADLHQAIIKGIPAYQKTLSADFTEWDKQYFKVKNIARRLKSGTGSLGTNRFYLLIEGGSNGEEDDRILDVKEQQVPPMFHHMSLEEQQEYQHIFQHEGERHALAFKALAEHPDKYLGWMEINGKFFSVRERSPYKGDFPTAKIDDKEELYEMARIWGKLLATRHERASHGLGDDPYLMPKTLHTITKNRKKAFVELVLEVALNYADCVEQDWHTFLQVKEEYNV